MVLLPRLGCGSTHYALRTHTRQEKPAYRLRPIECLREIQYA